MKRIIVSLIVCFLVINGIGYATVDKNTVITVIPAITTDVEWEVTLNFNECGGNVSYVVFGEAIDANDGPPHDSYDVPLPPLPPPPYIKTWLNDSLPVPYDLMMKDYREYNNTKYKEWNLTVCWVPKSPYPPTNITISWNISDVNNSEYGSVVLYHIGKNVEVDMLENSSYEFFCPAYTLQDFTINCTVIINPIAVDDTATTPEDTSVDINVTANDYDIDGTIDVTTVTVVGGPSHGSTSVNPTTGIVTYTPDPDYYGPDNFTYTVKDDDGATSNVATVSITVTPVNDPPVAVNDVASTPEDTAVVIDILANDYDIDGTIDPTTVTIITDVSHGSTSVNPTTGVVTYTPDPDYHGPDSFTYTVDDDDDATSNVATVSITVTDVNDPPVAVNDVASTPEDTPVDIDVTANDYDIDGTIDVTTVTVVGGPSHGSTSVNPNTGIVTYTPDLNYYGPDSFTYTVKDDDGDWSNVATVSITVTPVNDPPVAVNDVASTPTNTPVVIDILANDYDIDGTIDPTTVTIVTDVSHGSTSVNLTTGVVTYTPDSGYHGPDYFTYTVKDDNDATSNIATVSVTVLGNDPPNKPNRPSGKTIGKSGVVYTYTTSTTDPNNDQIWYKFSWGDGTHSGWVGPYNSGVPGSASHAWKIGNYEIKVKAKDDEGLESPWSDPLPIIMPVSTSFFFSFLGESRGSNEQVEILTK